jgi:hypothetical protein
MKAFNLRAPDVIMDDAVAREIIIGLGLFKELDEERLAAKPMFRTVAFREYIRHEALWVLAGCCHGFEKEEDNGFFVATWPKDLYSRSVLSEAREEFARKAGLIKVQDESR